MSDPAPKAPARRPLASILAPRLALPAFYLAAALVLREVQFRRLEDVTSRAWMSALAWLLLAAGEALLTAWFEARGPLLAALRTKATRRALLLGGWAFRASLWATAILALIELPARVDPRGADVFVRSIASRAWPFLPAILTTHPWTTAVTAAVWLALVEGLVFRRRVLRGVVVMVLAPALVYGVLTLHYHRVLTGPAPTAGADAGQDGVKVVFDAASVTAPELARQWTYPRALVVDEGRRAAYVAFGQTLDVGGTDPPNLWRVDLDGGAVRTITSQQVRMLAEDEGGASLYAFPWHRHELLRIDKASFTVDERIDLSRDVPSAMYEPVDLARAGRYLFVAFTGDPYVLKWDTREGRAAGRFDPREAGLLIDGDECCCLAWSPLENALFVASRTIRTGFLSRVDPETMRAVTSTPLPSLPFYAAASTVPPSQVFVLAEYERSLFRLTPDTLAVTDVGSPPPFSRLAFDGGLDRLLVGDYMGGRVLVMDRDGRVERSLPVGDKPVAFWFGNDGTYVLSAAGILHLDRQRLRLTPGSRPGSMNLRD